MFKEENSASCENVVEINTRESEEKNILSQEKVQPRWKNAILGSGSVGFGDTVKHWIETVSFGLIKQKPGCGCQRRQHRLNKWFPNSSDA